MSSRGSYGHRRKNPSIKPSALAAEDRWHQDASRGDRIGRVQGAEDVLQGDLGHR